MDMGAGRNPFTLADAIESGQQSINQLRGLVGELRSVTDSLVGCRGQAEAVGLPPATGGSVLETLRSLGEQRVHLLTDFDGELKRLSQAIAMDGGLKIAKPSEPRRY